MAGKAFLPARQARMSAPTKLYLVRDERPESSAFSQSEQFRCILARFRQIYRISLASADDRHKISSVLPADDFGDWATPKEPTAGHFFCASLPSSFSNFPFQIACTRPRREYNPLVPLVGDFGDWATPEESSTGLFLRAGLIATLHGVSRQRRQAPPHR